MRTKPNDDDIWKKASDYANKEAPKLLKELEEDFRKVLGIDNERAST